MTRQRVDESANKVRSTMGQVINGSVYVKQLNELERLAH